MAKRFKDPEPGFVSIKKRIRKPKKLDSPSGTPEERVYIFSIDDQQDHQFPLVYSIINEET
jgi:hypothetical protein